MTDLEDRLRRAPNSTLPVAALWRLCGDAAARIHELETAIRWSAPHLCADLGIKRERDDG